MNVSRPLFLTEEEKKQARLKNLEKDFQREKSRLLWGYRMRGLGFFPATFVLLIWTIASFFFCPEIAWYVLIVSVFLIALFGLFVKVSLDEIRKNPNDIVWWIKRKRIKTPFFWKIIFSLVIIFVFVLMSTKIGLVLLK